LMPILRTASSATADSACPASPAVPDLLGTSPARASMSVVLPAPLGPTTVTSSRSPTRSDTSQTATASPCATSSRSISSIGLSQIRADDVGIAHDLPWKTLGDDLAAVQDDDAVGQVEHRPHDVLDEDDRRPAVADPPD